MNIIKYTNRLNTAKLMPISTSQIDSIALHHMAHSTAGIDEVLKWHMDTNRWDFIGYSFWIGFDGKVYECRGLKYLPAAVAQNNGHIISIGFQGDYDISTQMPEAQFKAGVELIKYLRTQLPNLKTIDGHKRWNPTSCPGRYFPLYEMITDVNKVEVNVVNDEIDQELIDIIEVLSSFTNVDGTPMMNKEYWLKNTKQGSNPDPLFVGQLIKNLSRKIIQ